MDNATTSQRIIDTQPEDQEYLARFQRELEMLYGMVLEAVEEHPTYLLSPVMRQMLADKAHQVQSLHGPLKNTLCVDNPYPPLEPYPLR